MLLDFESYLRGVGKHHRLTSQAFALVGMVVSRSQDRASVFCIVNVLMLWVKVFLKAIDNSALRVQYFALLCLECKVA